MVKVILICLIVCAIFEGFSAKPTEEDVSYVEGLNIQFENDQWTCGDVKCPADTFGCRLRYKTDTENKKLLYQSFTCFDKDKTTLKAAADIIEMPKEKQINIDIESYQDAVSVFTNGFGLGGYDYESANGVVEVDKFNEFKESARNNRQSGTLIKLDRE